MKFNYNYVKVGKFTEELQAICSTVESRGCQVIVVRN